MRLRTLAAAAVAVALALGTAGPSLAKPSAERAPKAAKTARPAKAGAQARQETKARRAEAQARRKARFVAVGVVTAASGNSITLVVKGGSARSLRGKTQVFTVVSGASVSHNGQAAAVSAIQAGDHAMVKGMRTGDTYSVQKVRAHSREEKPATSPSSTTTTSAP